MPTVNLELQMKFLRELDDALTDALGRYAGDGEEKLAELKYMKNEVIRARRIIAERKVKGAAEELSTRKFAQSYGEAAYS
ncbi:MAG: hypothetical protein COB37_02565 [Kordiimonadales bacterium]|nr:MAG: hypothetical protein COB37_02565 [Kordiimonadales bacterium]